MVSMVITFGLNETAFLGEGWHEREPWGRHSVFRYASRRAMLTLRSAWAGAALRILLAPCAASSDRLVSVIIKESEEILARRTWSDTRWRILETRLPDELQAGATLWLETSPLLIPHSKLANGDRRSLGLRVAAIHIDNP